MVAARAVADAALSDELPSTVAETLADNRILTSVGQARQTPGSWRRLAFHPAAGFERAAKGFFRSGMDTRSMPALSTEPGFGLH
jgi:hypothetical protein